MPYLISGQNVTGTGSGVLPRGGVQQFVGPLHVEWADRAFVMLETSGNSASATLWGNAGDNRWMAVTSWSGGVGTTATAQITSFFYSVCATVDWVSGGSRTGTVYMQYAPRKFWL